MDAVIQNRTEKIELRWEEEENVRRVPGWWLRGMGGGGGGGGEGGVGGGGGRWGGEGGGGGPGEKPRANNEVHVGGP